jgi:hypothetical protein
LTANLPRKILDNSLYHRNGDGDSFWLMFLGLARTNDPIPEEDTNQLIFIVANFFQNGTRVVAKK